MILAQPGDWPSVVEPRLWDLERDLAPLWIDAFSTGRAPRLCPVFGELYLLDGKGDVFVVARGFQPGELLDGQPTISLPAGSFRPAYRSGPIFCTENGDLYRWEAPDQLRKVWQAGTESRLVMAYGLPDQRVLLLLYRGNGESDAQMLDTAHGQVIWGRRVACGRAFVLEKTIICVDEQKTGRIFVLDARTGIDQWQATAGFEGVPKVAGIVGENVWFADAGRVLREFHLGTGRQGRRLEMPGRFTRGILAPNGLYHTLSGNLYYQAVDLLAGKEIGSARFLTKGDRALFGAVPMLLTTDGRLLFHDGSECLYALELATQAELTPPGVAHIATAVWRASGKIREAWTHSGCLFVLGR